MSTFLYFGYGSNMLTRRLHARCPSARPRGMHWAIGYQIDLSKRSKDGSEKATLVPQEGGTVPGVIFEISESECDALNRAEGYSPDSPAGYQIPDAFKVAGPLGKDVSCQTYIASGSEARFRPYDWYLALVIAGALEHSLPNPHIEYLQSVPWDPDPKHDRKARQDAISILAASGYRDYQSLLPPT